MSDNKLTPETVQLNEVAPEGFCAEPRILSQEVWKLRCEIAVMREAVARLVEVLREKVA